MKKLFLGLLVLCCTTFNLVAQAPNKFNYQAVVKDASGNPISGAMLVRMSILDGSATGTEVYKELFDNAVADAQGILTLQIGSGQALSNTQWGGIIWESGPKFLKVEIKPSTAANYITMGDPQQLLSVPYAQEAKGLDLPFARTVSLPNHAIHITNYTDSGISATTNAQAAGLIGECVHPDGNGYGVLGLSTGWGLFGRATKNTGIGVQAEHISGTWAKLGTETASGIFNGNLIVQNGGIFASNGTGKIEAFTDGIGDSHLFLKGNQASVHFWKDLNTPGPNISLDPANNLLNFTGAAAFNFVTPIYAHGAGATGTINYCYLAYNNGAPVNCTTSYGQFSIFADNRVLAAEFNAVSDARIKNIIGQSDARRDLSILTRLKVTDYSHKDFIAKGSEAKKGFIAQEVETVFPEAVSKHADFIPDIYRKAVAVSTDEQAGILTVALDKPTDLKLGDRVRLITDKTYDVEVKSVSDKAFTVTGWTPKDTKEVFVFGKEVSDFRAVDYDRIFTLNVSATQALAQEVDALKAQNALLTQQNNDFQAQFRQLESKLTALTAQVNNAGQGLGDASNK
jgi:hypothetical protein